MCRTYGDCSTVGFLCAETGGQGNTAQRGGNCHLGTSRASCDQKKAIEEGRSLVYVGESGFYLLPAVARTWAPSGQTPVLRSKLTRDHLSVISGITGDGELLMQMYEQSISSHECVRFLKHLVRHLGKVTVVWDGTPIHRSKVVQEYLRTEGRGLVHLERLPGYALEVNPDEGVWQYLKHVELRNICCRSLEMLRYELRCATKRLRNKPDVLLGCFTPCLAI
jgi:transposase